ncbi:MAG: PilZ domain-containing protein [Acidobacteria bacterium]|nr:PilZ domain-containing protein [Acidobacteriota bacterium]
MRPPTDDLRRPLPGNAPRELEALRAALDGRLTALETALADPAQSDSIEGLMIELARVATAEADAAAARACLDVQSKLQEQSATLRETEQALQAERAATMTLRRDLDRLRSAFEAECGSVTQLRRDLEGARSASRGDRDAATHAAGAAAKFQEDFNALQSAATARIADLEEASGRLTAELEAVKHAALAAEAEARARYDYARDEAARRIRDLELEVEERNREVRKRGERIAALEAAPRPAAPPPSDDRPVRRAKRLAFPEAVQVSIDDGAAVLVDLSTCGAQVLSPRALKPNRVMRVQLGGGEHPIVCNGSVIWARLEPADGSLMYRAGMAFTTVNEAEVLAFLTKHAVEQ